MSSVNAPGVFFHDRISQLYVKQISNGLESANKLVFANSKKKQFEI